MTPKTERTSRVLLTMRYNNDKNERRRERVNDSTAFVLLMKFWSILERLFSLHLNDIKRRTKPLFSLFLNRVIHT